MSNSLCPNPDRCGSCGWSHIPYEKQLEQKLGDINGSFALKELPYRAEKILPAPKTAHYRNRMDFVIDWQGNMGLREKGKWWKVIDNHPCFLADEQIDDLFYNIRDTIQKSGLSYYDRKANTGLLRYAVIRSTTLEETMVTMVTSVPESEEKKTQAENLFRELATNLDVTTFIWAINNTASDVSHGGENIVLHGSGVIEESIENTRYRISPNAFFQTNPHAAPLLLRTVEEFCGDLSKKTLLDLYCGTGFFAVHLAGKAKRTIGAELVEDAITDARKNAALNGKEVEFHVAPTENFNWETYAGDVVILDPPRSGLHPRALEDVMRIAPQTIVYVSCNYKNLAREMVILQEKYDLTRFVAVDMFPHTPHVEVVVKLERKSARR